MYIYSFIIIVNTEVTYLKLDGISYDVLIGDAIQTATLVQEIPVLIGNSIGVPPNDIFVASITRSALNETLYDDDGEPIKSIIVSIAIPIGLTDELQLAIDSSNSSLYSAPSQIPSFIDRMYPVNSRLGNYSMFF